MNPASIDDKIDDKFLYAHQNIRVAFFNNGIFTYGDLMKKEYIQLLGMRGIANLSIDYMQKYLKSKGFEGIKNYDFMSKKHKNTLDR